MSLGRWEGQVQIHANQAPWGPWLDNPYDLQIEQKRMMPGKSLLRASSGSVLSIHTIRLWAGPPLQLDVAKRLRLGKRAIIGSVIAQLLGAFSKGQNA